MRVVPRLRALKVVALGVLVCGLPVTAIAQLTAPASTRRLAKPDTGELVRQSQLIFGRLPERMPGSEKDSRELIALGRRLYFERGVSVNRQQACNDCHRLDGKRAGVDNSPTATGARGQFGDRNGPTVLNAGFQVSQFWDGREPNLAAQAKGPPLNPIEMGMPDGPAIARRLSELGYESDFQNCFGGKEHSCTFENFAEAIAAFERTLITRGRFDDFVDGKADALSIPEQQGLHLVLDTGCVRCHGGPLFGGALYQPSGIFEPYPYDNNDPGREKVTKRTSDRGRFKVPMLRNITLTAPYFHNGKVSTLAEAVDLMARMQLDRKLNGDEIRAILEFLGTLADKNLWKAEPAAAGPWPAWKAPQPDALPAGAEAELVRYGRDLLDDTAEMLGQRAARPELLYNGSSLSCRNCHLELGTRAHGAPWVGVVHRYPSLSGRSGKTSRIEDRINDCFQRSLNGKPLPDDGREMKAIVAYFRWLSQGVPAEKKMPGQGWPAIRVPNRAADSSAGRERYEVLCQTCHGVNGQGYQAETGQQVVPPVWGPHSYNNGAGMARVLTAAAFIRSSMPLGANAARPMLTDDEAYDLAGYVNRQSRPQVDPEVLSKDYPDRTKKQVDCPYGPYADGFSQEQHQFGPFPPILAAQPKKAGKAASH